MKYNLIYLAGIVGVVLFISGCVAVDFWIWRVQHPGAPAWSRLFDK